MTYTKNFHDFVLKELVEEKDLSVKEIKEELSKLGIGAREADLIINDIMPQIRKKKRNNAFWYIIIGIVCIIISVVLFILMLGVFFYGIMFIGIASLIRGIVMLIKYSC